MVGLMVKETISDNLGGSGRMEIMTELAKIVLAEIKYYKSRGLDLNTVLLGRNEYKLLQKAHTENVKWIKGQSIIEVSDYNMPLQFMGLDIGLVGEENYLGVGWINKFTIEGVNNTEDTTGQI